MKFRFFILLFISVLLFSCTKNPKSNLHQFFNETNLQEQLFEINITRDTTLLTASGCILKIAAGSLQSDNKNVKLEIKEAINLKDILMAGLTTKSGNKPLSSAGMIYLNVAKGYKATIIKPIEVLVPSKTYNPAMQVYKGEKQDNANIDWQNPIALAADETSKKISVGEQIFKANCSNCHKVDKDFTGPSLLGITYRRPKKWLYDFMKSPAEMIGKGDCYSRELFEQWKPTVMTAFPNLETGGVLDSIFAYIKAETDKRGMGNIKYEKTCCDSCDQYQRELSKLQDEQDKLKDEQEEYFNLDRTIQINKNLAITDSTKYSDIDKITSTFYTIEVNTFGWFNIDVLYENEALSKQSILFAKIQGEDKTDYIVSLVIPNRKIFMEGYIADNGKEYVFKESDGEIILPQNEQCFIVAYAQKDEKIFFGKTPFTAGLKQTIVINTKETTKDLMLKEFSRIGLETEVEDVKNVKEIKNTEIKIDSLKKLLPKNCDCDFFKKAQTEPVVGDAVFYNSLKKGEKQDYTDTIF